MLQDLDARRLAEQLQLEARLVQLSLEPARSRYWGVIQINGRELPFDAAACDWCDAHVVPKGWFIIRRPLNRQA